MVKPQPQRERERERARHETALNTSLAVASKPKNAEATLQCAQEHAAEACEEQPRVRNKGEEEEGKMGQG